MVGFLQTLPVYDGMKGLGPADMLFAVGDESCHGTGERRLVAELDIAIRASWASMRF